MAAGTEGFTDTTGGQSHLGSLISKAIAARRFAEDERKLAEEKAKKAGYDSLEEIGVEKGYFFKAALKSKFGGSYLSGKRQDIKAAVDRVKLLKNPKAQFWNFVDNKDSEGKDVKKLNQVERFRKQFDNYNFQSAKRPPEKEVKAETEVVPKKMSPFQLEQSRKAKTKEAMLAKTEAKTAKAASSGGGGRVSREDILTAVTAIASSLEKTAQSINNTIGETKIIADGVQSIKTDVVVQLSERTDSIESKLDAIVAAINEQTALQKKMNDDAETKQDITERQQQGDGADSGDFDDVTTKMDERLDDPSDAELNLGDVGSPAATSAQDIEFQQQDRYMPQAETGGIISGPDEGYLAKLHGDEMVIPLDNNYTQGQPSAMDGKVRPVPETPALPKFETGTPQSSGLGSKIGFSSLDLGNMGSKSNSAADNLAQPLMDAMSLPMMVAGGTILSSVNQLMNQLGPENSDVAGEVAKVARPIADVFGLPNNLVSKVSGRSGSEDSSDEKKPKKKEDKKKEGFFKNILSKMGSLMGGGGTPSPRTPAGDTPDGSPTDVPPGAGESGDMITTGAKTTYYDPDLGGINASGFKTAEGLPATSTGEGYKRDVFSAAAFPPFLAKLPRSMTVPAQGFPGGRTLKSPFNVVVTNTKTGKKAVVRVNDVGPGVEGHSSNHMLDLSVASRAYLGTGEGYSIAFAKPGSKPGPLVEAQPERKTTSDSLEPGDTPTDSQAISQDFGMNTHDKMKFMHDGVLYEAYKTEKGFDLYRLGGTIFRGVHIKKDDPTHAAVLKSFLQTAREKTSAASITPPAPKEAATTQQEALKPPSRRRGQGSTAGVAALNIEGKTSATTTPPPDSQAAVVPEGGDNSLTDAYNSTPVTAS